MQNNKDLYYSQNPMQVYDSFVSRILNKLTKNYSREEVASEINLKGQSCLDIACGDGELLNNFLYKKYKKAEGIDISKDLIDIAKSKQIKNCTFIVGDIDDFVEKSIKSGKKYDVIYLLAILEHIQWPSFFIKNIFKILNIGGHVVVEVPNVAWLPHRISMLLGKFPITAPTTGVIAGVYDEHIRFFTHKTLNQIAIQAGFKRIKIDCSGKFRFIKRLYPEVLSPDIVAVFKK